MQTTKIAIIVAGGKGERMNADIPKQFLEINGLPILMHTLNVFNAYDPEMKLILVLPAIQFEFWKALCKKHDFTLHHQIVEGGTTRFHSVKNGIDAVTDTQALIAVHDGVRPLVSHDTIQRCFDAALSHKAAIPVVELVDSIRRITGAGSEHADRSTFRLVQTPQIFDAALLRKAYEQEFSPFFTDDASVVEALGHKVELVEGNRENIKITTEFDLRVANAIIR